MNVNNNKHHYIQSTYVSSDKYEQLVYNKWKIHVLLKCH